MKYSILFILLVSTKVFAQSKQDSCCLSEKDLIGVWQRDTRILGDVLEQNFKFYKDGRFDVNFSDESDDARDIYGLRGKYRLVGNKLFLTITSRIVNVGGAITTVEPNANINIFNIDSGEVREIPEPNPKELEIPCIIDIITRRHIKIDFENYYKVPQ